MPTLNIDGHKVTVGDEFLKLSPQEQHATVDEIAASFAPKTPLPTSDPMGSPIPGGDETAPQTMPYGEQMSKVGGALDNSVRAAGNGIPFMDRIAAAGGAATGVGGAFGDYSGNLERERVRNKEMQDANPAANHAAGFVGASMLPIAGIGKVAGAVTPLAKLGWGALTGAGVGGLQGASDTADLTNAPDAAINTAKGAGIGAALGGTLPLAAKGIGIGYNWLASALQGNESGISKPALKELIRALGADGPEAAKLKLAELGDQAMIADTGPSILSTAQGLVGKGDAAHTTLVNALAERNKGTNTRLASDVDQALGPAVSPLEHTAEIKGARSDVHKILPDVFANAPKVDATAPIASIGMELNKAVGPEKAVLQKAKEYLTEEGKNGVRVPITDPEKLHNAKVALDKLIKYGDQTLGVSPGAISMEQGAVSNIRKQLNKELRDQIPGYKEVMDASSGLAKEANAVKTGTEVLGNSVRPDDLASKLQRMSPDEVNSLKVGSRATIDQKVGTRENDLLALKNTLQGADGEGWNAQKLGMIHGEEPVKQVASAVGREAEFRNTNNKVYEGSQTQLRANATKALEDKAPDKLLPRDTLYGDFKHYAKKPFNALGRSLMEGNNGPRNEEMARILSAQGPEAEQKLMALIDALSRKNVNIGKGTDVGNKAALAAALIGNDVFRGPHSETVRAR